MKRWFFQGFEKRVKGLLRQHVDFVNNVNSEFTADGSKFYAFPEISYLVDSPVGGAVDFDDVHAYPSRDTSAGGAFVARRLGRAFFAV